jgi:hypothetical protein
LTAPGGPADDVDGMAEPDETSSNDARDRTLRRAFVAAWVVLGVAGALNHTIAEKLFDRRFDLVLPHLKYGHVMFNLNPSKVSVFQYARADGVRRDLADLVSTPALGYKRARLAINAMTDRMYLAEVCLRATRATGDEFTFYVDDYDVSVDPRQPSETHTLRCTSRGLIAK